MVQYLHEQLCMTSIKLNFLLTEWFISNNMWDNSLIRNKELAKRRILQTNMSLRSFKDKYRINTNYITYIGIVYAHHCHHHHLSFNREGWWGTTDDFATSFLHFSLFSTALWDLANSRPVHFLMLSSYLFLFQPFLLPPFIAYFARWFWPDLMNGRHAHTTAICVSLRWSGGLRVVRLPARSCHGFPRK